MDILARILKTKESEAAALAREATPDEWRRRAALAEPPRDFAGALRRPGGLHPAAAGALAELLAAHLAATDMHWPWEKWGAVAAQRPAAPQRRFELLQTCVIQTTDFAFTRKLIGFETFAKGELIATDGVDEIRSPCDDCTVFMPAREAIVGREAVYLTCPIS